MSWRAEGLIKRVGNIRYNIGRDKKEHLKAKLLMVKKRNGRTEPTANKELKSRKKQEMGRKDDDHQEHLHVSNTEHWGVVRDTGRPVEGRTYISATTLLQF